MPRAVLVHNTFSYWCFGRLHNAFLGDYLVPEHVCDLVAPMPQDGRAETIMNKNIQVASAIQNWQMPAQPELGVAHEPWPCPLSEGRIRYKPLTLTLL